MTRNGHETGSTAARLLLPTVLRIHGYISKTMPSVGIVVILNGIP